ncbi:porin [Burkholderia ubonensis]|uniref:porin n=1 Tax=Burkholderia ubonensis TaxID=101571 RepID=UPI000BA7889F|nr:porin [Burkholderia ubonensis]PAK11653.1 porin [Burkholderia ubonensis]RQP86072.1 porin [Burkholderia ubonensis]
MKKSLIAAALVAASFAGTARAQSSVTLYGVIDVGIAYVNNVGGHSQYSMGSGNLSGSRWGLRGEEDLGGGLKTLFVLENGFSIVNGKLGQGGAEFGRKAYVGLSSSTIGTVTFGRQYDLINDLNYMSVAAQMWAVYTAAHPGDVDNTDGTNHVNNSIKFRSVSYGGFSFAGFYSFGGIAGNFNRNQIWSVGANYNSGPLTLAAVFLDAQEPNFSYFGSNPASSTTGSNMTTSRVYSGYASAKRQQIFVAGASYAVGAATFGANYSNTQFKDIGTLRGLPATGAGGDARFHDIEVNVGYQLTPAVHLGAGYNYLKGYGVNGATYHQGVIGAGYLLSKRTDFYADAVYQHASGTDSTGGKAVANLNGLTASTTPNQVQVVFGMRHRF